MLFDCSTGPHEARTKMLLHAHLYEKLAHQIWLDCVHGLGGDSITDVWRQLRYLKKQWDD